MYHHEYEKILGCKLDIPSFKEKQVTPSEKSVKEVSLDEKAAPVISYDAAINRLLQCQVYVRAMSKLESMITDEVAEIAKYADKTGNKDLAFMCAALYGRKEFYLLCLLKGFKPRKEDANEPFQRRYY